MFVLCCYSYVIKDNVHNVCLPRASLTYTFENTYKLMEIPHTPHTHTHSDQHSVSSDSSDESGGDDDECLYRQLEDVSEVEVDYLAARLVMEGPLTRKTCKKGARKVSVSANHFFLHMYSAL